MTKEDLEYANDGLDSELMQLFQYEMPTLWYVLFFAFV
jgi:hypothetical protein